MLNPHFTSLISTLFLINSVGHVLLEWVFGSDNTLIRYFFIPHAILTFIILLYNILLIFVKDKIEREGACSLFNIVNILVKFLYFLFTLFALYNTIRGYPKNMDDTKILFVFYTLSAIFDLQGADIESE